eukprot:Nk52_evm6s179 gene=Nk52_evmTU6s179
MEGLVNTKRRAQKVAQPFKQLHSKKGLTHQQTNKFFADSGVGKMRNAAEVSNNSKNTARGSMGMRERGEQKEGGGRGDEDQAKLKKREGGAEGERGAMEAFGCSSVGRGTSKALYSMELRNASTRTYGIDLRKNTFDIYDNPYHGYPEESDRFRNPPFVEMALEKEQQKARKISSLSKKRDRIEKHNDIQVVNAEEHAKIQAKRLQYKQANIIRGKSGVAFNIVTSEYSPDHDGEETRQADEREKARLSRRGFYLHQRQNTYNPISGEEVKPRSLTGQDYPLKADNFFGKY